MTSGIQWTDEKVALLLSLSYMLNWIAVRVGRHTVRWWMSDE